MICGKCGSEIEDNAVICGTCGAPVDEVTGENVSVSASSVSEVTQEMPSVSAEAEPKTGGNRPTIVMPEITGEKDLLEQLYPEQEKPKGKASLIVGLVAAAVTLLATVVLVIFGVTNNWWRASVGDMGNPPTSPTAPTSPVDSEDWDKLTAEQLRQRLTPFTAGGLNIYLGSDFVAGASDERSAAFQSETLEVTVSWGAISEVGKNIDSSREFAVAYAEQSQGLFEDIQRTKKYGIYYTVATSGSEVTVSGFYVQDGYGWMVQVTTNDYQNRQAELIRYVTLGLVSKDFQPPVADNTAPVPQEFSFAGLTLTMDNSLRETRYDGYCVYENDRMLMFVQFASLSEMPAKTSQAYADYYYNKALTEGWSKLYTNTLDGRFHYVVTMDDDDGIGVVGMYTYGQVCWLVTAESSQAEEYQQTLIDYVTGGKIVPEQIPTLRQEKTVEFAGLELSLPDDFRESRRDETQVTLSNGELDVYILTGGMGQLTDAKEMAQRDYQSYKALWDNVEMNSVQNVYYVAVWENVQGAVNMVQGYYVSGDTWWIVKVEGAGVSQLDKMLEIAVGGQIKPVFQEGPLAQRDRITLTGQTTGQYRGLQISYGPSWTEDANGYTGGDFSMTLRRFTLQEKGVDSAQALAWQEAKAQYQQWEHYEVGVAGGVSYVLLWDSTLEYYTVIGTYANSTTCWEISVSVSSQALLDQAIWYATAGIVTE